MQNNNHYHPPENEAPPELENDLRLYAPHPDEWRAALKQGWERDYCFAQNPGEDFFHLLMNGEIYLQRGDEKYCLNCALRRGYLTRDRMNWQRGPREKSDSSPL